MLVKYRSKKRIRKLLRIIPFPDTGTLLDVSSGDGSFLVSLKALHPKLELYGIDLTEPEVSSPQIHLQIANATELPFPKESFDVVICAMSLHHYQDANLVIKEINRVLRKSGIAYLADIMPSNRFTQQIYNFMGCSAPYHFEKYYTQEDLNKLVTNNGLSLTKVYNIPSLFRLRTMQLQKGL